ncbi:hypothetical protein HanIR_Chr12g0613081 [Helianthus annuus]|nr:hypothetical protein HanIR_Chr12g0613081 [Helianthus annuus]
MLYTLRQAPVKRVQERSQDKLLHFLGQWNARAHSSSRSKREELQIVPTIIQYVCAFLCQEPIGVKLHGIVPVSRIPMD